MENRFGTFGDNDSAKGSLFTERISDVGNELIEEHNNHIANTNIHVTAEKQAAWNQNTADLEALDVRLELQERLLTSTIPTAGWSGTAPYTIAITVPGLTDSRPDINPIYSATLATARLEKEAWNTIGYIDCTTNTMTVTCLEEIPTTAINVELVGG
jgi:hypothetical protein